MRAILALEDGRYFLGEAFGAAATDVGEVCFNTSMTGYQEVLTDPSYRGQIVAMTAPQIGNYGVNALDQESYEPHVRGFVIEELSPVTSNWRSQGGLDDYLRKYRIPGVQGIDTRALTKHLRSRGAMQGCVSTEEISVERAIELAQQAPPMEGSDFVQEVTPKIAYDWDPEDTLSRRWTIVKGDGAGGNAVENGESFEPLAPVKHQIVAYDFGLKLNILRRLRQQGFKVKVVPADTKAEEVLAMKPDGVFLSNGPGDPGALTYAHQNLRGLMGKTPIFGICLGHQLLGYAFGGKTFKLKFGHRGGNQPVKDLRTGKVTITSQNHGFAVDPESLPADVEVTHVNLNDQTVEGLAHKTLPIFSVQYHPEASPGPNDASYFFDQFAKLIEDARGGR
ncbi:MAG TPA: glutamine-hydrolyzing carbamoyl-phosphate synthase small subunit [Chthoniobacteraceae bacterium]|jgi:carbamoyl-phosphate synthase small subunit